MELRTNTYILHACITDSCLNFSVYAHRVRLRVIISLKNRLSPLPLRTQANAFRWNEPNE